MLKQWHYSLSLQIFPFSHILNHKFCLHENENQLHWSLDVVFKEDAQLIRKDNAPLNMSVLCKIAMGLLNKSTTGKLIK